MIWAALPQLLTPIRYLRIRHSAKVFLDWLIPACISVLATTCLMAFPQPVRLHGSSSLISVFTDLLQVLVGFYIAALAAVATFDRPSMDAPIDGEPMLLYERRNGARVPVHLSRRRFLSMMFGYLAFLALGLYFLGAIANLLAQNLLSVIPVAMHKVATAAFLLCYLFGISSLFVTTLLGLHYLSDRIHR